MEAVCPLLLYWVEEETGCLQNTRLKFVRPASLPEMNGSDDGRRYRHGYKLRLNLASKSDGKLLRENHDASAQGLSSLPNFLNDEHDAGTE